MLIGALEAGGTKMVCAIGNEKGEIFDRMVVPTKAPAETMPELTAYFKKAQIEKLGIGCFGPLDLKRKMITNTPKTAWVWYRIGEAFEQVLHVPVALDTDVNAAMLGEAEYGHAKGVKSGVYITVGTGVGMGIMCDGKLVHGMMHPEAGHIPIVRNEKDTLTCVCPYHENCLEGLAAGPAIEKRYGMKGSELPVNHPVWELEADYISQAVVSLILTVSPEKIILGGGVMKQTQLFDMIREQTKKQLGGYIETEPLENMKEYIVPPSLGDNQGVLGAISLVKQM